MVFNEKVISRVPIRRWGEPEDLGGIAVYGASIMLIAQMYHMEGNPPDAVLMWALGALLAVALTRSNAALAATFVLLVVWTSYERGLSSVAHWSFLPAWAAAAAAAAWLGWRPGLHLAAISLVAFVNPMVSLIWFGGLALLLGAFISLWPERALIVTAAPVRAMPLAPRPVAEGVASEA